MDENAINGLQLLELKDSDASIPEIPKFRIRVEGYDTWLAPDVLAKAVIKHFSSCGKITEVSVIAFPETDVFLPTLHKFGEGAAEKALKLSGTDVGGCTVVATAAPWYPEPIAKRAKTINHERTLILVTGYDTSLPPDDLESPLGKHFASCGLVRQVVVGDPGRQRAVVIIFGQGAEEKALALSGSDMGGYRLVTSLARIPDPPGEPVENKKRITHAGPHLAPSVDEAEMVRGAEMAKNSKNTEKAEVVWGAEMAKNSKETLEAKKIKKAEKAKMVWGAEILKRFKNTEKAKMVWEDGMGSYMTAEVKKMLWEAEMARRAMKTTTTE